MKPGVAPPTGALRRRVLANDGGLAVGQAWWAAQMTGAA